MEQTDRKVQDYLPFYLGQEVERYFEGQCIVSVLTPENLSGFISGWDSRWHKLRLRALSGMRQEEINWWWKYMRKLPNEELEEAVWTTELNGEPCEPHWTLWSKTRIMGARCGYTLDIFGMFEPNHFIWLIKKGFDLFNLIPDGLAINKTDKP